MVAIGLNNIPVAEQHFSEAARLEPDNKLLQFNRAIIHLQAKDQQVRRGAKDAGTTLCGPDLSPGFVAAPGVGGLAKQGLHQSRCLHERVAGRSQSAEVEFLRLAMLARANREQRQEFAAQAGWRLAVRAASERPEPLTALARMARKWGWEKEEEELLWVIAQRFPAERWALQALNRRYLASGNTRGVQKVYSTLLSYDANDVAAKNNFAATSLLLNLQTNKAHEMARQAYARVPDNEAFASTYAYSLHLQGKTKDGLKVLESLKPAQLEQPAVAVYYGVLIVANGDSGKAKKYLELAAKGQLLPEEKAIVEEAKSRL